MFCVIYWASCLKTTNLPLISMQSQVADRLLTSCTKWFGQLYRAVTSAILKRGLIVMKHTHTYTHTRFARTACYISTEMKLIYMQAKRSISPAEWRLRLSNIIFFSHNFFCTNWWANGLSLLQLISVPLMKMSWTFFFSFCCNVATWDWKKSTDNNYFTAGISANCEGNFSSQKWIKIIHLGKKWLQLFPLVRGWWKVAVGSCWNHQVSNLLHQLQLINTILCLI